MLWLCKRAGVRERGLRHHLLLVQALLPGRFLSHVRCAHHVTHDSSRWSWRTFNFFASHLVMVRCL